MCVRDYMFRGKFSWDSQALLTTRKRGFGQGRFVSIIYKSRFYLNGFFFRFSSDGTFRSC